MWVHFHNETKIREYKTEDWDELITLIEKDIGTEKGIEKITFKASKSTEECEVDPDLFDEILATPNNSSHGVFNVYFAVKRLAKLPNESEPRELYCIDFEHFVQQVEEIVGSSVKRITYSAKGPGGKAIEFEVGEDTFTELPGLIFNTYFEDEEEDGDEEDEKKKPNETAYTIQIPSIPHPFVIRGDLYWGDLVSYVHQLAPKDRLDKVIAKSDKGKEVAATEASFNGIDSDVAIFHITFKPRVEVSVVVQLSSKPSLCTLMVGQFADLQEQIEQLEGKHLEAVSIQRADKNGTLVEETVDEDTFDEFAQNSSIIFKPTFTDSSVPKHQRIFVQMPAYKHPLFLTVANLDDLMSQLEAIVSEEDGEIINLMHKENGTEVELDGDTFAKLSFPNAPLTVHVKEPNIRCIQFDWEDKPRRVFCRDLDQMLEAINDLLPDGKEVAELSYTIAGPHGQQITQPVDEMAFLDAAEDPSLVFNVKVVGSVTAVVHFPDDGRLRSYKAGDYADLVKQVETDTALLVSHLTSAVEMDGHRTEVTLTAETFDQQMAASCQVYVYFKEVPTLQVLLPDSKEPVPVSVPDFADMMAEIRKLAGLRAVEKVSYTVTGPKGQKMEMEFTPSNWEDVAEDPQNTVINVHLGPAPKQYCVEFPEGPVTVNASGFEALQKEIRKQAGGRRVSTVLIERMNSQHLTPEAYEQIQDTPDAGLKVVLSPVEEGSWKTVQVKFPFEKSPRQISGCQYEGVVQELNRLAPEGCLELERLVYFPDGIEIDVDAETFDEAYSPSVIFHAYFTPDPKYEFPPRLVSVDGTDQKFPVYAPAFKDFMDFIEEIAAGRPIVSLVPEMEGAAEITGEEEYDDMAKAFYDLPRDTNFRIVLAKGSQAAGARVKFPHSLEELLLEAHTFDRLMHLIKTEARSEGYKVAKVTYFVEGPAGQKMECQDLDEDVFENLEDLDQCVFKVYYEGQPKGSKLVLYPDDDQPHQVLAQTYTDFIEAIMEENPEKPRIELILYEVPAPKGGTVSFPLTEEAWDDVADEANVVFRVIFPLPTTELLVQFTWDDAPKSVPAGSFEELHTSIGKMCPADQKVIKLTYTVEGPSGHKLEFPLNEEAFGDIDDADTVIKVHTVPAKALYVQYPAAPISWQADFKAFLKDVQANGTPGKKVRSVYVTHPGKNEVLLDANRYKELQNTEGFALRVEYE